MATSLAALIAQRERLWQQVRTTDARGLRERQLIDKQTAALYLRLDEVNAKIAAAGG